MNIKKKTPTTTKTVYESHGLLFFTLEDAKEYLENGK